jgi:Tfp pilus assembly protein PilN
VRYNINLIRLQRAEEHRAIELRNRLFTVGVSCLGLLGIAALTFTFQILGMEAKLSNEQVQLARIEQEYSKYRSTRMVIDKADIERLDSLQSNRVFWTKKLAAMAVYLPEDYWTISFSFDKKVYRVKGYGYISTNQDQLITLDDYLNKLRADPNYTDVFKMTSFNEVSRADEEKENRERVSFEYSSMK